MLINIFGWFGAFLVLLGYLLISLKKITPGSMLYQGMNALGAGAIGVSSVVRSAWPAAALNFSWTLIAVYMLVSILWKRNKC